MTIDITKPLRTRDGREVRGVWQDGNEGDLFGWVGDTDHCYSGWLHMIWKANGEPARNQDRALGLVNAPEKHVRYVNFYRDMMHESCADHASRVVADANAAIGRVACVRVEFEEGRLDE